MVNLLIYFEIASAYILVIMRHIFNINC